MDRNQQKNIFRLSAILYAKTNNNISEKNIIRKVIEDALFCCGQEMFSLSSMIEYVEANYALLLSSVEIEEIVKNPKNKDRFLCSYKDGELVISLTESRKVKVTIECQQPNLIDFIDEYLDCYQIDVEKGHNLILNFLYELFTSNLDTFKRLLNEGVSGIAEVNRYQDSEKEIINGFLLWERAEKDKAIFDLANYSLEYCMLTNSKNTDFNLQNLKFKNFYLDTNVLFRAIGLNGEDLKKRTLLFLSKFKDVQENLLITHNTDLELKDTINYYIGKLERMQAPRYNLKVFNEYIELDSVCYAYHNWSLGRENNAVELFRLHLLSEYESVCDRFNIIKENKIPFDEEQSKDIISDYVSGIQTFAPDKTYLTAEYDAKNILWIETQRKDNSNDIYGTKHFFLSSDKSLCSWDYSRLNNGMLVVMPPSQWLGIILRYIERTNDDYKSFICFLTMKVTDSFVQPEKILSIVKGIDEMTHDLAVQKSLLKSFIQTETEDCILQLSEEELEIRSKAFATRELDFKIKQLEEKNKAYEISDSESRENISRQQTELVNLNQTVSVLTEKVNELNKKAARDTDLIDDLNSVKLANWKMKKIFLWSILLFLIILLGLMIFFWRDWEYNFVYKLVSFFDNLGDSIVKSIGEWLVLLPITGTIYSAWMIIDTIIVKSYDKEKCNYWTKYQ